MGIAVLGRVFPAWRKRDEGNIIFANGRWTPAKSLTIAKLPNGYRGRLQVNITSNIPRWWASPVGTGEQNFPAGRQKATLYGHADDAAESRALPLAAEVWGLGTRSRRGVLDARRNRA